MKDKLKAYEEKLDAQLEEWNAQIALLKAKAAKARAEAKIEYNKSIEALQHRQDEARIKLHDLQSIEDLWNPVCKKQSLKFFEGNGFEFYSGIAGISYIKQLAMFRMLAHAGPKTGLRTMREVF